MIRIGILSHYHNSTNYGGALQAYALCKVLNDMGYDSEQIDVDCFAECKNLTETVSITKKIIRKIKPIYRGLNTLRYHKSKVLRCNLQSAFRDFNENFIPHSAKKYDCKNIAETLDRYDIFIVGSDQVWNPIWYFEPFFLSFAPSDVPKISYAASIAQSKLSLDVKQIYKQHLKDFCAVSVREENAVELLKDISPVDVEYVLDPTLLLDDGEWKHIASKKIVDKPYVFCYFLGENNKIRSIAKEYAHKHNLVLVNIQHATGQYHKSDIDYGDIRLEAPSPNDFLSLTEYADMVFTDSFHACVFSLIFKRQFFVFEREGHTNMSSRITSLMNLYKTENRLCNTVERVNTEYIYRQQNIDYSKTGLLSEQKKRASIDFLVRNLNEATKNIVKN